MNPLTADEHAAASRLFDSIAGEVLTYFPDAYVGGRLEQTYGRLEIVLGSQRPDGYRLATSESLEANLWASEADAHAN